MMGNNIAIKILDYNTAAAYGSVLEKLRELVPDFVGVRTSLPVVGHVVDLAEDEAHESLRAPDHVLHTHKQVATTRHIIMTSSLS